MTFNRIDTAKQALESIIVTITDRPPEPIRVEYETNMSIDEFSVRRSGNLMPHLTEQQSLALAAFMAAMRSKAEAEMLPTTKEA